MRTLRLNCVVTAGTVLLVAVGWLRAGDWPMWRYDAGRTAASTESLPDRLQPQWTCKYPPRTQVWDDTLNNDLMPYDRVFEPIIKDGRLFIGFNDQDKLVVLDTRDGSLLWTFYTEGPVRLPPVAWQDNVYFTSDDGHLYCVQAETGQLQWRFRGGPTSTRVLGNQRLISAWPARGGPVIADGQVYFAASIWPFMGTFICALDAQSGQVVWVNDKTSADYIQQPHSAPSFAGVAPQGALVVSGDYLIVPGGRSVPAVFDRKTGALVHFELNAGGKGNGGSLVMARGDEFFLHTRRRGVRAFELKTGKGTEFTTNEPVLADGFLFAAEAVREKSAPDQGEKEKEEGSEESEEGGLDAFVDPATDPRPQCIRAYRADKQLAWEIAADGRGDLIQAGSRLYAAGPKQIVAIDLPRQADRKPTVAWQLPVTGTVQRLLAAGGQLFAVTVEGEIMAFGAASTATAGVATAPSPQLPVAPSASAEALARADRLLGEVGATAGYALWYGADDEELLQAMVQRSNLQFVVVDADPQRVARLQESFDQAQWYGNRVSVILSTPGACGAPPFFAHVVLVGKQLTAALVKDPTNWSRIYRSVRPYGGALVPLVPAAERSAVAQAVTAAQLARAELAPGGDYLVVRRVGALEGAGEWTHQYGNIANTVKSDDQLVMSPLGLLWFGGSSNLDVLPRHGHGPPEQVVGGRLFIEGMDLLSCRDVYTGRVLWKQKFPDLGTFDIYFDSTYKDTPLDPAYNQVHIPGANARGTNFVATQDEVYLVVGAACQVLDAATGKLVREIRLPADEKHKDRRWGFIGIYRDVLLGGAGFAQYSQRFGVSFADTDAALNEDKAGFGSKSFEVSASAGLIAFNRHTGKVLWELPARYGFLHNGIVAGDGKVYCLDRLPQPVEEKLKRRGNQGPINYRIVAVDSQTGKPAWEVDKGVFGTWLGYSEEYHLLLQAGAQASDRMSSEVGAGMAVYEGATGEVKWRDDKRSYSGPCILHHDTILTNANAYQLSAGAFSLLDGTPKMIDNPLTGEPQPWQLCRAYGCNSIVASEKLLTFRSGAAGFYDLQSLSGTGNLGGFKSGCTSNLIVADGVLNAPDYTRTCSCGYQNQTSLALVHMPALDTWAENHLASLASKGARVQRMGLNFGAPGDRMAPDGTLWLEFPFLGGQSADLAVQVQGDEPTYWRQNSLNVRGSGLRWVAASGVEKVRRITIPLRVGPSEEPGLSIPVSHADDDAEEQPDGSIDLTSSDLEFVTDKAPQTIGLRFDTVDLPRGTRVRHAAIQFTCDETTSDPTELVIHAEDAADAARFVDSPRNISTRPRTKARVPWTPDPWTEQGAADALQRTPDLAPLVQAVIDRADWQQGNPLAFVISGQGKRVAAAFKDKDSSPRLVIDADVAPTTAAQVPPTLHTVRLYFAEPNDVTAGARVFDVRLQGQIAVNGLDIVAETGGPRTTLVKEFTDVPIGDALQVDFDPQAGQPLICGIEIIRQDQP